MDHQPQDLLGLGLELLDFWLYFRVHIDNPELEALSRPFIQCWGRIGRVQGASELRPIRPRIEIQFVLHALIGSPRGWWIPGAQSPTWRRPMPSMRPSCRRDRSAI